jgi:hypothetical protein
VKRCVYPDIRKKVASKYLENLSSDNVRLLSEEKWLDEYFSSEEQDVQERLLKFATDAGGYSDNLVYHSFDGKKNELIPFRYKAFDCLAERGHEHIVCDIVDNVGDRENPRFYNGTDQHPAWASYIFEKIAQDHRVGVQESLLAKIESPMFKKIFQATEVQWVLNKSWNPKIGRATLRKIEFLGCSSKDFGVMESNVKEREAMLREVNWEKGVHREQYPRRKQAKRKLSSFRLGEKRKVFSFSKGIKF